MSTHVKLPFLVKDTDRHGNDRWYVRRIGLGKLRLRVEPGHPDFLPAYNAARDAIENGPEREARARGTRASQTPGTIAWVAARYFASPEFNGEGLTDKSRMIRRAALEEMFREKLKGHESGAIPAKCLAPSHVGFWVDNKSGKFPGAALNRKKFLSVMCSWAVKQRPALMLTNPCRDAKTPTAKSEGFHTWSEAEVQQFEARHPIGTKARLAMALMLYLGVRISDAVRVGRQHLVRDAATPSLRFVPYKTRKHSPTPSTKPILPELAEVIAGSPTGDLFYLVNEKGQPFTDDTLPFRRWCDEAGLQHCTAHGLRKAAACRAVLNGANGPDLMAMFDWTNLAQAETYIKKVNREGLAAKAWTLLAGPGREQRQPAAVAQ